MQLEQVWRHGLLLFPPDGNLRQVSHKRQVSLQLQMWDSQLHDEGTIREDIKTISAVFLTLFKRPSPLPPLVLNMYVANFFDRLLKKCVNVCRDKIRQNNA